MHGFPRIEEINYLIGKSIVCFRLYFHYIDIIFDDENWIRIENMETFVSKNSELFNVKGSRLELSQIVSLPLTNIAIISARAAELTFGNKWKILLDDDNENYESIVFTVEGGAIPV